MGLLIKLIIIVVLFAVAANLFFVFSVQKEAENVFLEYGENEIIPAKNHELINSKLNDIEAINGTFGMVVLNKGNLAELVEYKRNLNNAAKEIALTETKRLEVDFSQVDCETAGEMIKQYDITVKAIDSFEKISKEFDSEPKIGSHHYNALKGIQSHKEIILKEKDYLNDEC